MFRASPRLLVLFSSLILVIASCTPAAGPSQTQSSSPGAKKEIIAVLADVHYPGDENTPQIAMFPSTGVYETLVNADENLQIKPGLALSWTTTGSTWRFKLRTGVKFQNGNVMDAKAVAASLNRVAKWQYFNLLGLKDGAAQAIDDSTVELSSPLSQRVLEVLSNPSYAIWDTTAGDPNIHPMGTGPFKFVDYVKNDHLTVERNPLYWGTPAGVDKITFRYLPDETTRKLALQAGQADIWINVTPDAAAELTRAGGSGITLLKSGQGSVLAYGMSPSGAPPFDLGNDIAIRRAVGMAIDSKKVVDVFWNGFAEVNKTYTLPSLLGTYGSTVQGPSYNLAGAAALLEQDGWKLGADGIRVKNGRRLSLQWNLHPTFDTQAYGEGIQAMLKGVGIEIKLNISPDSAAANDLLKKKTGDIWFLGGTWTVPDPCNLCYLFVKPGSPNGSSDYNALFYPGPQYDQVYSQVLATSDPDKLKQLTAQAMKILVDDQAIVIPVAGKASIYAIRGKVTGLVPHPSWPNTNWGTVTIP